MIKCSYLQRTYKYTWLMLSPLLVTSFFSFTTFSLWNLSISLSICLCSIFPEFTYLQLYFISLTICHLLSFFCRHSFCIVLSVYIARIILPPINTISFLLYLQGNTMVSSSSMCSHRCHTLCHWNSSPGLTCIRQYIHFLQHPTEQMRHLPACRTITAGQTSPIPSPPFTRQVT